MNVVGNLDMAILCVAAFFLFFLGLVYHLRQEDKREGYPLESSNGRGRAERREGFPPVPRPKTFPLPHGRGVATAAHAEPSPEPPIPGAGPDGFPIPLGSDPLAEGIGAASW